MKVQRRRLLQLAASAAALPAIPRGARAHATRPLAGALWALERTADVRALLGRLVLTA